MSGALSRRGHRDIDVSGPGRLVARQPVIGIVNRDMIAVDKIGRKNHQIGAAGMTQRGGMGYRAALRDDQIREFPRWRNFLVDASDLAPGAVPDVRVESLRKVGHFGERDLVGG